MPASRLRLELAYMHNGDERWVMVDETDTVHVGSVWLRWLADLGRSPYTVKAYGDRVVAYLTWTAQTTDWRSVNVAHLRQWMRAVAASPHRSPSTVARWMIPLRSFYSWADGSGLLASDVATKMTTLKYFPPGSPGGGEYGGEREVLATALRPESRKPIFSAPDWIDSAEARAAIESLEMNTRDRFLVDLLYYTGIRAGEALSLFTRDMHFGGAQQELGCRIVDPHFHVRMNNPTENGARAKGRERTLYVYSHLIDRYVDFVIERDAILGDSDSSRHVFVNLYTSDQWLGRAMTRSSIRDVVSRLSKRINFPMSGPHMFRHTFATRLVRGIDVAAHPLDVVQELLGHRSAASTRVYTHDREPAMKEALKSIQPRTLDMGADR